MLFSKAALCNDTVMMGRELYLEVLFVAEESFLSKISFTVLLSVCCSLFCCRYVVHCFGSSIRETKPKPKTPNFEIVQS